MNNLDNNTVNNTGNDNNKTFTQEEVNRIVQERLSRERSKGTSEQEQLKSLEEREKALAVKEQTFARKAVLKSKNIPEEVYEALNCTSEETFNKSLEILSPYIDKLKEPIRNAVGPINRGAAGNDSIRVAMGLK